MLRFGVRIVEVRQRDFPVHRPWSVWVVSTPDECGRLESANAYGTDKDEAVTALTEQLAEACGVEVGEIALDEIQTSHRRRRRNGAVLESVKK